MKTILTLLMMTLTAFTAPAFADAESERANLARLVGEIDYLSRSLEIYHADAPRNDQYAFDYLTLSRDLLAIRQGIVEYIKGDLSLARDIPPLHTEYVISDQE